MDLDLDLDPELTPKSLPHFGTHMVIKTLDGSNCKNVSLVPQLHISGIHNPALQCLQDFRAQLESELSGEAQKLDHKYDTCQIKMERKHEQKWAGMAQERDTTFQEVFSMTSLADSAKLLPWCISPSVPLHHMDDTLAAAMWQGKTVPTTTGMPKPEEPSAPGLLTSPACPTETPPPVIPLARSYFWEHPLHGAPILWVPCQPFTERVGLFS